jgi:hypothetical protein
VIHDDLLVSTNRRDSGRVFSGIIMGSCALQGCCKTVGIVSVVTGLRYEIRLTTAIRSRDVEVWLPGRGQSGVRRRFDKSLFDKGLLHRQMDSYQTN